jgi:iron complex outermembrane receptor protein
MISKGIRLAMLLGTTLGSMAVSPGASAQAALDDSSTGDIIVTARRSEERLQDVPISITVFNQQQISNRNIVTAADLGTYTPRSR